MELQGYRVLSEDEISQIHEASIELLERMGVAVLSQEALSVFSAAGARVDPEARRVRFTRALIEDALAATPSSFTVFYRDGDRSLEIGGSNLYFVSGMDANYVWDPATKNRRAATKQDLVDFARLSDALPNIHIVAPMAVPHDVPGRSALVHAFEAVASNTTKPIYITPGDGPVSRAVLDMAQAVAGDVRLSERSFVIGYAAPTSPLTWQPDAAEAIVEIVGRGIPCAIGPCPLMGMTGPMTPAGAIAVGNAEQLSGIVMAYLIRKGTPIVTGVMPITTDMRLGFPVHGDAGTALARLAGAQMARFYNLPGIVSGPNSDSHCLDEQNAWEKMLTIAVSVNAGINIMVNSGAFATVSTVSYEQLVLDNELSGLWQQVKKGIEVSEETLALDLIETVGVGGNFLAQMHTLKHWRSDYWIPEITTRKPYTSWREEGQRDVVARAAERAQELLAEHQPKLLATETLAALAEIREQFEAEYAAEE
jgi:trimethylamine--corrinoid protein Co-methyltransferase